MQGLIVQSFIDELLNRVDIVEFIDSYVPLKKQGLNFVACCPFHHEKTPSFNVNSKKQFYHCFGCNASGNAIGFAMNYLQQNFPDAVTTLAARTGMQVVYEKNAKHKPDISLYSLLAKVSSYYTDCLYNSGYDAIQYLKTRGLSSKIVKQYKLGYAPNDWQMLLKKFPNLQAELVKTGMLIANEKQKTYDRYRHRLIFPIENRTGKIIGFGGRALSNEQKPKYLNSPETVLFQKSKELYGLYQVINNKQTSKEKIIVVEGYMDVLALAQFGVPNVVATLGTATTTYHLQLLSKYTKEVVFCFDGDNAGRQAAWRALESTFSNLDKDIVANFVFLPEGYDPDSFIRTEGSEEFLKRINSGAPLHKFFFESLLQDIDIGLFTGKSKLINLAKPYLVKMPESAYKQVLLNELARLTHIDVHRIAQLITDKKSVMPEIQTDKSNQRTPMRLVIAILLQHPEIYEKCADQIQKILAQGYQPKVLLEIINHIASNPHINTAGLVEKWRNTPIFGTINELAGFTHKIPLDALASEVVDIVSFMSKQDSENKIQQLIEKSRKVSLTESERRELQNLLKNKHNLQQEK